MWSLLFIGLVAIPVYDFFFNSRQNTSDSSIIETDSQRVRKLYRVIRKTRSHKEHTRFQQLFGTLHTSLDTVRLIVMLKWDRLMLLLFSPKRLNDSYITVSYYLGCKWYTALIPHPARMRSSARPLSFTTESEHHPSDQTANISKYLGPCNDFYGQPVRPTTFGLPNVTVTLPSSKKLTFQWLDNISVNDSTNIS